MVWRRAGSSTGFKAFRHGIQPRRGCGLAALPVIVGGLFWAGAATAAASAQASCAPALLADARFLGGVLCGLAAAGVGGCFFSFRRSAVAKRVQSSMTSKVAHQEQVAREFQEGLIQGVQGLIATLQLVAQDNPLARTAIEDALNRAQAFLIESRGRLQALQNGDFDHGA